MEYTHLTDLGPGPGNPRNSEGAFIALKDGRVAFAYSRFAGESRHDGAYAEIAAVFWDGERFSEPRILFRPDPAADETNTMSVSVLRMANGDVGLFRLVKYQSGFSEYLFARSADEMETFGAPVCAVGEQFPGYYVVNNDRVVALRDGRLVVPAALHAMDVRTGRMSSRGEAVFFASSDDGRTWSRLCEPFAMPGGAHSASGLQEPGVAELPGGTLYGYFRTDLGRHYESFSPDGGRTWSPAQPSAFTGPCSPLLIKYNEYDGKYYAVWNPTPSSPFRYRWMSEAPKYVDGDRSPLVIAVSENGLDFSAPQIIEDDPMAGYAYPAIHFTGPGEMLLAYCAGNERLGDRSALVRTQITRLRLD